MQIMNIHYRSAIHSKMDLVIYLSNPDEAHHWFLLMTWLDVEGRRLKVSETLVHVCGAESIHVEAGASESISFNLTVHYISGGFQFG